MMTLISRRPRKGSQKGFTLIEVLVALVILLAGIISIVQLFPISLQANKNAELTGAAVLLAQQKVDEMRRDADALNNIIVEIQGSTSPTDSVVWPEDDRLTYSYSGVSELSAIDTPSDPRDDFSVARVIVRLAPDYDPEERVIYEMRFDI